MAADEWIENRKRLEKWVPDGEELVAGCIVAYGKRRFGMGSRMASLVVTDRRMRLLRHLGHDVQHPVRGVWFEIPRGEAVAVRTGAQVRVQLDRAEEIELRRHSGGSEKLQISEYYKVHAQALLDAFPSDGA